MLPNIVTWDLSQWDHDLQYIFLFNYLSGHSIPQTYTFLCPYQMADWTPVYGSAIQEADGLLCVC